VFAAGENIGTVKAVVDYAGTEMLSLDREGEEILIPFVHAFLKTVDTERKRIDMELPEGLVELNKGK
jgi:16S rRNA processing protein RimM